MGTDFDRTRSFVHEIVTSGEKPSRDAIVETLAAKGLTELEATAALRQIFGLGLIEGRSLLRAHPAWSGRAHTARTLGEVIAGEVESKSSL